MMSVRMGANATTACLTPIVIAEGETPMRLGHASTWSCRARPSSVQLLILLHATQHNPPRDPCTALQGSAVVLSRVRLGLLLRGRALGCVEKAHVAGSRGVTLRALGAIVAAGYAA